MLVNVDDVANEEVTPEVDTLHQAASDENNSAQIVDSAEKKAVGEGSPVKVCNI